MKKLMMFLVFCTIGLMILLSSCSTNTNITPVTTTGTVSDTSAHTHSFGEWMTTKEPTCTEAGEKECYCSCGEKQTQAVPAKGHSFGEWITTKESSCTEAGEKECYCSCGEKQTQVIPALGHDLIIDEAISPTCTSDGKTEGSHCSKCGETIKPQETIVATGHDYDSWTIIKDSTCAESGSKSHKCTKCGEIETESIPLKDHTIVIDKAIAGTCTVSGKTEGSHCSVCGKVIVKQKVVVATGHEYGEWTVIKAATCTDVGSRTSKCLKCGKTIVESIPLKEHSIVIDPAIIATCTNEGKTEGSHCSVCGKIIVAQKTIEATHDVEFGICKNCNMVIDENAAINHYITLRSNANSGIFTTYYMGSSLVRYTMSTAYPEVNILNSYDGQIVIDVTVDFVTQLYSISNNFSGTGFLSYEVYNNNHYVRDGTIIVKGYGGGLASVSFMIKVSKIEDFTIDIYFDDYYMY